MSAIGIHASSATLIVRPGARSKRFVRFAASATSSASATTRAPDASRRRSALTSTDRQRAPADDLHQPGRDAPVRERAEVTAKALVGLRPDDVVEQAEQPEPDAREQHQRAATRRRARRRPRTRRTASGRPRRARRRARPACPSRSGRIRPRWFAALERRRVQQLARRRRRAGGPSGRPTTNPSRTLTTSRLTGNRRDRLARALAVAVVADGPVGDLLERDHRGQRALRRARRRRASSPASRAPDRRARVRARRRAWAPSAPPPLAS